MGVLELLATASVPVLEVLLVTGVGSLLATSSVGILSVDARNHLNNVVFYVLNPSLVITNLSQTVTIESIALLWFMPINILLTFVFGSAFGWLLIKITKPPANLRGLILGCCSAGNLGNLLLIIVPSICKEKGSPFGAPDICRTYGLAYVSLSMAIGAIFIWSYVYNIVRKSSDIDKKIISNVQCGSPHLTEGSAHPENISSTSCNSADGCSLPVTESDHETSIKAKAPIEVKKRRILSELSGAIDLKKIFAPSTIGVLIGFVIGAVPLFRHTFIGETAPLRAIQQSVALMSDGAIPILTLIMGGNLTKGLRGSGAKLSIIAGVIAVRYIVLPLVGIAVVRGAIELGLLHHDPLYHFILLLQYALPPAMSMGTITQLFGAGESECSVIFLWTYALASVALTFWSICFMSLVATTS